MSDLLMLVFQALGLKASAVSATQHHCQVLTSHESGVVGLPFGSCADGWFGIRGSRYGYERWFGRCNALDVREDEVGCCRWRVGISAGEDTWGGSLSADRSGPSAIAMRQIRMRWRNELGRGLTDVIHVLVNGISGLICFGRCVRTVCVPPAHCVWWEGLGGIVDVVEP